MSFRYHGNYCGPGYTGGRFSSTGDYTVKPIDALDSHCRKHDYGYEFGDEHQADHDLLRDTRWNLNKEGLLKFGFTVKDYLYNDLFLMPKTKTKQKALLPSKPSEKSKVAFAYGQRLGRMEAMEESKRELSSTFAPMASVSSRGLSRRGKAHGRDKDVIEEVEYITDLSSNSTSFSLINTYAFNPAQSTPFPWASSIAKQYEKWVCEYVRFIYKPLVSQYASLGQTGKVILSFDYDASDSPPSTKQQAEDIQCHVDGLPFEYMELKLTPSLLHGGGANGKYTRAGPLPGGSDIKNFDGGNLYVSTSGLSANSGTLGELHVAYRFRLVEPILSASSNAAPTNNQVAQFISANAGETVANASTTRLALSQTVTNGLSAVNAAGLITLQPGNYLLMPTVSVQCAQNILSWYLDLYNATTSTSVYNANFEPEITVANAAALTFSTLSQSWYVSVNNGPAQYEIAVNSSTTGANNSTVWGSLVILAV